MRANSISGRRLFLAVFSAALVGWFILVAPFLAPALVTRDFAEVVSGLVVLALFGLPMAIVPSFVIGVPLALLALRRGWTSPRAALGLGALAGSAIGLCLLGWQLLTFSGAWGGSEGMLWVDGWPTAVGWRYELRNMALYAFAGGFSGLAARAVVAGHLP